MTSPSSTYYGDPTDESQSPGDDSTQVDETSDSSADADGNDTENSADEDSETFLSPKSVAGDVSPGDKMTFQCVKVYDDEVAWKPVKEDSKPAKPSKMSASDEIDAMAAAK